MDLDDVLDEIIDFLFFYVMSGTWMWTQISCGEGSLKWCWILGSVLLVCWRSSYGTSCFNMGADSNVRLIPFCFNCSGYCDVCFIETLYFVELLPVLMVTNLLVEIKVAFINWKSVTEFREFVEGIPKFPWQTGSRICKDDAGTKGMDKMQSSAYICQVTPATNGASA